MKLRIVNIADTHYIVEFQKTNGDWGRVRTIRPLYTVEEAELCVEVYMSHKIKDRKVVREYSSSDFSNESINQLP